MNYNFYKERNYERNTRIFSGLIYESDFNSCRSMSDIAERICTDQRFDDQCRRNILSRERVNLMYGNKDGDISCY